MNEILNQDPIQNSSQRTFWVSRYERFGPFHSSKSFKVHNEKKDCPKQKKICQSDSSKLFEPDSEHETVNDFPKRRKHTKRPKEQPFPTSCKNNRIFCSEFLFHSCSKICVFVLKTNTCKVQHNDGH